MNPTQRRNLKPQKKKSLTARREPMAETLKPCPFCYKGFSIEDAVVLIIRDGAIVIECPYCRSRGPRAETQKDAIEAWNKRENIS
jgi:Lar family restriction alleviation protein